MKEKEPIETTETLFTRTRSRAYRDWARISIYLLVTVTFLLLCWTQKLDRLENIVLDGFIRKTAPHRGHPSIVLFKISQETLAEIGSWPWPRRYHAITARLLDEWKAAAVLFDFEFENKTLPEDDLDLAQTLSKIKTPLYLPLDLESKKERKFWIHGMPVVLDKDEGKASWTHSLPEIETKAKAIGHRKLVSDEDGILRRFEPFLSDGNETYPFVALPLAFDFLKKTVPPYEEWKHMADGKGRVIIPWTCRWDEGFVHYNYSNLIHSFYAIQKGMTPVIDPEEIAGKICLVGLVSEGDADFRTTPLDVSYPVLGVYANVINSILTGNWIRPMPLWVNCLCLLGIGLIVSTLFFILRSSLSLLTGLSLAFGWFLFCFLAFLKWHLWFYAVYPVLLIFCLFAFSAIYVQLTTTRERSDLFHLATRDGLTELYVIRHFRLIMNQIVREAGVRKQPLSVILLDVDHFKTINDTYGHPAGDMVLKNIAAILVKFIRKRRPFSQVDFAARYGGEEFIIMLRKAGLREAAERVAERIRKKVEEDRFEWEGKPLSVTVSLGVATLHLGENVPDPMVHRADAALYKAKEAGRNRVCTERT